MRRQRGQSAVEFALMAPIVFAIIFAMIYGGIMFMDYLNFNNYARIIAREVSIAKNSDERTKLINKYNEHTDSAGVYNVSFNVETQDDTDVVVTVEFRRSNDFMIMPRSFDIVYRMPLEPSGDTTE